MLLDLDNLEEMSHHKDDFKHELKICTEVARRAQSLKDAAPDEE